MKFEELQAISKGTPSIYIGRKYINRCNYRKAFEIDEQIIVVLNPKMVKDENGNETPMLSKNNEPIMDRKIYIPFKTQDGQICLTQTKSPLIYRLVRNLPVTKTEKDGFVNDLEYHEAREGLLRFGEEDYKYGDKTAPVVTLEAAEED
jgi:hypothetical protein